MVDPINAKELLGRNLSGKWLESFLAFVKAYSGMEGKQVAERETDLKYLVPEVGKYTEGAVSFTRKKFTIKGPAFSEEEFFHNAVQIPYMRELFAKTAEALSKDPAIFSEGLSYAKAKEVFQKVVSEKFEIKDGKIKSGFGAEAGRKKIEIQAVTEALSVVGQMFTRHALLQEENPERTEQLKKTWLFSGLFGENIKQKKLPDFRKILENDPDEALMTMCKMYLLAAEEVFNVSKAKDKAGFSFQAQLLEYTKEHLNLAAVICLMSRTRKPESYYTGTAVGKEEVRKMLDGSLRIMSEDIGVRYRPDMARA